VSLLRIVAAFLLILIGLVGLALPIMPGWIFIIPGLMILGERYEWARRLVDWVKRKFKSAAAAVAKQQQ
jgi:uncharacterized protein YqgC (DUF456 family)